MRVGILHIIDILKGGGAEEWLKELARLLNPEKFEIKLCYLLESPQKTYIEEISNMGIKIFYLGIPKNLSRSILTSPLIGENKLFRAIARHLYLPYCLTKLKALKKTIIEENIKLIHTHLHYSFMLASLVGRALKIPVVCQVPQMKLQTLHTASWSFFAYRIFQNSINTFYTNISKDELICYAKIPRDKIRLIKGVIDLSTINIVKKELNPLVSEFNLKEAYPVLFSIGRFVPEKGHKYAIEIAARVKEEFPQTKLILLGEGWELQKITKTIKERKLDDTIILPGYRRDLNYFYSIADIYLRTSIIEGASLASYSAMAYGNPIVAFDTKAPTETIVHGRNGFLVPPGDIDKMVEYIFKLARDEDLRKQFSMENKHYAATNLDIRETIRAIENEYLRLCDGRKESSDIQAMS